MRYYITSNYTRFSMNDKKGHDQPYEAVAGYVTIYSREAFESLAPDKISRLKSIYIKSLDLTNNDLELLRNGENLRQISISGSDVSNIDFSPLSICSQLQLFAILDSTTTSVDLSPLSSCIHLQTMSLWDNCLTHLDLSPIRFCTELKCISLDGNNISELNLSPLSSCILLETLNVSDNSLTELDLRPLQSCRNLTIYDSDVFPKNSISFRGIKAHHTQFHWHICGYAPILNILDAFEDTSFDMRDVAVRFHQRETSDDFFRRKFLSDLRCAYESNSEFDGIQQYLDRGGSTALFDIDDMSTTGASILIPQILELREKEKQQILMFTPENRDWMYDLSPIVGTHIIEMILHGIGYPCKLTRDQLWKVQDYLHQLGIMVDWVA